MVSNDTEIPTGKLETPKEAAKPAAAKTQVDTKADKKKPDYSRYSEEQQALLRESDEQHAKDVANANSFTDDRDTQQKKLKAAGMRHAARFRQITGKLTAKERAAKDAYEASNHVGKAVSVDGVNGEIVGHAFGRVQVKLATGEVKTVDAEKIGKPAKSNAAQGDQSEGGVVSASGTSAESTASSSFGAVADAEPTIKQPEATSNEIGQGRDNAPGEEVVYQAPEDEAPATPPAPKATKPKAERRKKIMEASNPPDEARNNGFKASDAAIEKARKAFEGLGATERPVAVSADQDAAYMRAVESGDMETAQRMVDAAAKAAGLVAGFHGTPRETRLAPNEFKTTGGSTLGAGAYFAEDKTQADRYDFRGDAQMYFLDVELPGFDEFNKGLTTEEIAAGKTTPLEGTGKNGGWIVQNGEVEFVVRDPSQIKSADPVTYDESGNVIPLSQRFILEENGKPGGGGFHFSRDSAQEGICRPGLGTGGAEVRGAEATPRAPTPPPPKGGGGAPPRGRGGGGERGFLGGPPPGEERRG
ncbi:MAG: hypothetical protein IPM06_18455 [Rhizobiales bacterium]|nr:hypothetical protein [Hyphomicrobiales bacterium]